MLFDKDKITEIFYLADEFCEEFSKTVQNNSLGHKAKRKPKMTNSEVITILILYHGGCYKNLKHFYNFFVKLHMKSEFPKTVSYNRFVELQARVILPLTLFLKTCSLGDCSGISFIDSTPIRVCKNKRIPKHRVFDGIAERGKSTMGYFYGFKLHFIINDKGEILNFMITPGNVDDRNPLKDKSFVEKIRGKLYADKGYVSKELTEVLFVDGLHLITYIRNNMKNVLMEMKDKILLRKRSIIETINDQLKNICDVEHSRHRSFNNFITNLIAALITYAFFEKKPAIKYETIKSDQLGIF
ncbi:IS982 family transposase [Labilibaculum sp. K2S]|uniref:IS982 family transposase n=1 Tax=Labilibaculum sp. K2S TaxID=3056386 RepID=UPI0025A311C6|nr:IS982 family transposase [Labilibaculum sp. K2S]MDM8162262.1 IS982 family transposase [Labilibaculum sp. K2S]